MPDQVTRDIKDKLNVADVVGTYIPLKKAGSVFKARCPFHNEKTPSFQVSPHRQIWHCFGCGEGGDIYDFVMRYENVEFPQALKILADKAGVQLPEFQSRDPKADGEKELLVRINTFAARFYHELLLKDPRAEGARAYLEKRGLKPETIAQWQIGFAPDEFHALEQALLQKGALLDELVRAGVSSKNERGQVYDRFRGRITFPIFSYFGEVIGFSARILADKDGVAKYINTPETAVYSKGKVLFGLYQAKQATRRADELVLVEGQMDCISAHQAGIENVVATSGTALGQEQLDLAGRMTKNFTFCFDQDAAGLTATRRAVELYLGRDFTVKVISLPEGTKDPDELIKQDPEAFRVAVKNARLFLDHYADAVLPKGDATVEQKKAAAKELLPLVARLSDPIEREHYVRMLSARLGTSTEALEAAMKKPAPAQRATAAATVKTPAAKTTDTSRRNLEMQVLGGVLSHKDFKAQVLAESAPGDFTDPSVTSLIGTLKAQGQLPPELLTGTVAKESLFMVESLTDELSGNDYAVTRELIKSFALLRLSGIRYQLQETEKSMKAAESASNRELLQSLRAQFGQLTSARLVYEKQL